MIYRPEILSIKSRSTKSRVYCTWKLFFLMFNFFAYFIGTAFVWRVVSIKVMLWRVPTPSKLEKSIITVLSLSIPQYPRVQLFFNAWLLNKLVKLRIFCVTWTVKVATKMKKIQSSSGRIKFRSNYKI